MRKKSINYKLVREFLTQINSYPQTNHPRVCDQVRQIQAIIVISVPPFVGYVPLDTLRLLNSEGGRVGIPVIRRRTI